jgi:Uncharacterized conserved protein
MRELYNKLMELREVKKVAWKTIEIDYVLSWILVAISKHEKLGNNMIFKGGTALKKCYFGDYRFSEDLDFTEIVASDNRKLYQYLSEMIQLTESLVKPYGQFDFGLEEYFEKKPHPLNQAAYIIKVQLPWHRKPMTNIKLEISRDEIIFFEPKSCFLLHEYGEEINCKLQVYSLEEIVLEKFRAILQNQERLNKKGWTRSRVRDFYDLWRIFGQYKEQLDIEKIKAGLLKKCELKKIMFSSPTQFFNEGYLKYVKKDWCEFLGKLVSELPEFDRMLEELKQHAYELF